MKASEIRQGFLDYFRERGHTIVESAPVVPADDPTLLFTNAGMNQFKDVFLGTGTRSYTRVADTQKCIRAGGKHNDLEEVGKDSYHQTFFEMLGNWSFGDYFKREAIEWAWELLTQVWKIDPALLYATVHHTDDEAEALWPEVTGVSPDRVLRFGDKDNFWEMGEIGPCGPCSEIHIDRGPDACDMRHLPGHKCEVNGGCARYIELWNLVFIQFERKPGGSLELLPAKHVDTGAGFERITQVLQGKYSNYDTDLFMPLIRAVEERSGVPYDPGPAGTPHRVISDHLRALSFSIADGADPDNTGRGYVLRRILRRASRFFHKLGVEEPAMKDLVGALADNMGDVFPELRARQDYIVRVIEKEEVQFLKTLDRGVSYFRKEKERLDQAEKSTFPGQVIFFLKDTLGFPADLTRQMAEEDGCLVDMKEFDLLEEEAKERARGAAKFQVDLGKYKDAPPTEFTGYERTTDEARVAAAGASELVLDRSPFYAESGGQVGDTGRITAADGRFEFEVLDTQKTGQVYVHVGEWLKGDPGAVERDTAVLAKVDRKRGRDAIRRNHTATHLLHWALHRVLAKTATQKGSVVSPTRLRFDFNWDKQVNAEQLRKIERLVNERVAENHPLLTEVLPIEQARERGAIAMFGEKYGEEVRVVNVADFSLELCGGTHVARTGDIGVVKIAQESAVSEGVRRIVALTGDVAVTRSYDDSLLLSRVAQQLKAKPDETLERIERMQAEIKELQKKVKEALTRRLPSWDELRDKAERRGDLSFLALEIEGAPPEELRRYGDCVKRQQTPFVGFFLSRDEKGKVPLVCAISEPLVERGWHSRDLLRPVAAAMGGGGGGKNADLCQGSGKDPAKIPEALAEAERQVVAKLG